MTMEKKTYMRPAAETYEMEMETSLLRGSKTEEGIIIEIIEQEENGFAELKRRDWGNLWDGESDDVVIYE